MEKLLLVLLSVALLVVRITAPAAPVWLGDPLPADRDGPLYFLPLYLSLPAEDPRKDAPPGTPCAFLCRLTLPDGWILTDASPGPDTFAHVDLREIPGETLLLWEGRLPGEGTPAAVLTVRVPPEQAYAAVDADIRARICVRPDAQYPYIYYWKETGGIGAVPWENTPSDPPETADALTSPVETTQTFDDPPGELSPATFLACRGQTGWGGCATVCFLFSLPAAAPACGCVWMEPTAATPSPICLVTTLSPSLLVRTPAGNRLIFYAPDGEIFCRMTFVGLPMADPCTFTVAETVEGGVRFTRITHRSGRCEREKNP